MGRSSARVAIALLCLSPGAAIAGGWGGQEPTGTDCNALCQRWMGIDAKEETPQAAPQVTDNAVSASPRVVQASPPPKRGAFASGAKRPRLVAGPSRVVRAAAARPDQKSRAQVDPVAQPKGPAPQALVPAAVPVVPPLTSGAIETVVSRPEPPLQTAPEPAAMPVAVAPTTPSPPPDVKALPQEADAVAKPQQPRLDGPPPFDVIAALLLQPPPNPTVGATSSLPFRMSDRH